MSAIPAPFPDKPIAEYGRGELAVTILTVAAATAAALVLFAVAPGLAQLARPFVVKDRHDRRRVRSALSTLERDGLVTAGWKRNGTVTLTARGKRAAQYNTLSIRQTPWDGKWRLLMFDVPEQKKRARIALGRKIIDMGMMPYQKSVYISPHPCERELRLVAAFLDVEKDIRVVVAIEISSEGFFRKSFGV